MRIKGGLRDEYDQLVAEWGTKDPIVGPDLFKLAEEAAQQIETQISYSGLLLGNVPTLVRNLWMEWLSNRSGQVNKNSLCLILYIMTAYWEHGESFSKSLPPCEQILLGDTFQEMVSSLQEFASKVKQGS